MSLVTEALRKARQEAAEREGRQRGIPRGLVVPPRRWRTARGPALALLVAAAAAAGAAGTWWLLGRRTPSALPSVPAPTVVPAAVLQALAGQPGATQPTEGPPPTVPAGTKPIAPTDVGASRGGAAVTPQHIAAVPAPVSESRPAVASGHTTAADEDTTPGGHQEPSDVARERRFVVDANLGYAKLHLDYIVYRPGSPFAGINGQQVVIGTMIEGFQVEEIGPELVRLRDGRGTVVLRTH
jgi:hypothetical protein